MGTYLREYADWAGDEGLISLFVLLSLLSVCLLISSSFSSFVLFPFVPLILSDELWLINYSRNIQNHSAVHVY